MKETNIYSKSVHAIIRIISLVATIILVISNTNRIKTYGIKQLITMDYEFFSLIINCIAIILFFVLIIFPTKLSLLSLIPFLYGVFILIFEPYNNLGILMFGLSITTLYARGSFNKHTKTKNIIVFVIFVCLTLSEIRFGKEIFLKCFIEKTVYSFTLFSFSFSSKHIFLTYLKQKALIRNLTFKNIQN